MKWVPCFMLFMVHFRFIAVLFTCANPRKSSPTSVSINRNPCSPARNIMSLSSEDLSKVNITACISPIKHQYSNAHQLVEMIEIHRMFGIDRFVFYNVSVNSNVDQYLRYYVDRKIIQPIQWQLDDILRFRGNPIVCHGQQAAQTDCLYRSLNNSQYVTFVDLDELLVVRQQNTSYMDIIRGMKHKGKVPVCDYQFRHAFFPITYVTNRTQPTDPRVSKWRITSLMSTKRSRFLDVRDRSKYIADVRYLIMPTVHEPRMCWRRSGEEVVPVGIGALHHYRKQPPQGTDLDTYTDLILQRSMKAIAKRIEIIHGFVGMKHEQTLL